MEEIPFQIMRFQLLIMNAFTVGNEEYYPKCNNVNDAKGLQIFLSLLQYYFKLRSSKS